MLRRPVGSLCFRWTNLVLLAVLVACSAEPSRRSVPTLSAIHLESSPLISPEPTLPLRWPRFLLAETEATLLWSLGGDVVRITLSANEPRTVQSVALVDQARGFDRLIAATKNADGTTAILDSSGRVSAWESGMLRTWSFQISESQNWGGLAVVKGFVYLLAHGKEEGSPAVFAYTLDGTQAGRHGSMPPSALVQGTLTGGGIVACPDGTIYFSYINSPHIFQLVDHGGGEVLPLGQPRDTFVLIPAEAIRNSVKESRNSGSVEPLVKLGLSGSRVMALRCASDGLLFRQVAEPAPLGTVIEVWDPQSERLLGTLPSGDGVLFDVRQRVLYLGRLENGGPFVLERYRYQAEAWNLSPS